MIEMTDSKASTFQGEYVTIEAEEIQQFGLAGQCQLESPFEAQSLSSRRMDVPMNACNAHFTSPWNRRTVNLEQSSSLSLHSTSKFDSRYVKRPLAPRSSQARADSYLESRQTMIVHQASRPGEPVHHIHPTQFLSDQPGFPPHQRIDSAGIQVQQVLAVMTKQTTLMDMPRQYEHPLPADFAHQFPQFRRPLSHSGLHYLYPQVGLPFRSSQDDDIRGHRTSMEAISLIYPNPRTLLHKSWPVQRAQIVTFPSTAKATAATSMCADVPRTPRGPPMKPRQSGHSLWVGNLPSSVTITDLKDHFSRGLTNDILSLKLMQRSSCAFVNYKTAHSCQTAMQLFHLSSFHLTRLVCRLRKSPENSDLSPSSTLGVKRINSIPKKIKSTESNGVDDQLDAPTAEDRDQSSLTVIPGKDEDRGTRVDGLKIQNLLDAVDLGVTRDRYFVLKSLTFEDLVFSTQTCRWTTQAQNEELLNMAYEKSTNVYLIFSVNRSGEYFGYARMESSITPVVEAGACRLSSSSATASDSSTPQETASLSCESMHNGIDYAIFPKVTFTSKTETAPRGRIVDDTARGTIFWEIHGDEEGTTDEASVSSIESDRRLSPVTSHTSSQVSSTPFRLKWITTTKLPFYRARGLRNALNGNRDVKIARDGTEVSSEVGAQLLSLFSIGNQGML